MPQSKGSSTESRGGGSTSGVGEYCCEIVKVSRANLYLRVLRGTSISERPASKVGVMSTSAKKKEKVVVSVVLVAIRRGVIAAGPHSTAAAGLKTENAVCVPVRTVLA